MSEDWKKRAMEAEAKLRGYRALRGLAHAVFRARQEVSGVQLELDVALDEMFEELACQGDDAPFDAFRQVTSKLASNVTVREVGGMTEVSRLDFRTGTIDVNASAPPAAKLIGLLFQLVQIADLSCARSGSPIPAVMPGWIQDRVPSLAMLLVATRLLNPEIPVDVSDVQALAASKPE